MAFFVSYTLETVWCYLHDAGTLEATGHSELAAELVRCADSIDPYADDFIWVGGPVAGAILDLILTLEGKKLGVRWDPAKDVAGKKVTVLGAEMCSDTLTMGISAKKAAAYREHLDDVLAGLEVGDTLPRRALEQLAGRLGFCTILSRWCTSFMAVIWRSLWPPGHTGEPPQSIVVGHDLLEDLTKFWKPVLADPGAPWLRRSQWASAPIGHARATEHHVSSSDASGHFGAGGMSEWAAFQRQWSGDEITLHITFKELIGVVEMIIAEAPKYAGLRIVVFCDNEGAVAYINRGGGTKLPGRGPILRLALAAMKYGFDVRAVHRSGNHMQTTGTDDISRATRRGVGALQGAAYTGGVFGVGAPLGNRVKQSLAGDGFKAGEKPADDLSHLRKLEVETLDGVRVHPHPGPTPLIQWGRGGTGLSEGPWPRRTPPSGRLAGPRGFAVPGGRRGRHGRTGTGTSRLSGGLWLRERPSMVCYFFPRMSAKGGGSRAPAQRPDGGRRAGFDQRVHTEVEDRPVPHWLRLTNCGDHQVRHRHRAAHRQNGRSPRRVGKAPRGRAVREHEQPGGSAGVEPINFGQADGGVRSRDVCVWTGSSQHIPLLRSLVQARGNHSHSRRGASSWDRRGRDVSCAHEVRTVARSAQPRRLPRRRLHHTNGLYTTAVSRAGNGRCFGNTEYPDAANRVTIRILMC